MPSPLYLTHSKLIYIVQVDQNSDWVLIQFTWKQFCREIFKI